MKHEFKQAWLTISVSLIFLLQACGGTEGGNPALNSETPSAADQAATEALIGAICKKLSSCFPSADETTCRAAIPLSTDIDTEIGLPEGFGTYDSIIQAEKNGSIVPNPTARNVCITDLGTLGCENAAVQSAYSDAAPDDYSSVFEIIPTGENSCIAIF
ncbi:MAG: hypothetical protein A2X94_15320 [Bdellovibrionales bacterium GWB1_55_8]|nr:MAG: hypothetical protein A2X94_15320 [Bdellovibrionales bacterium GWB1_55_8]